MLNGMIVVRKRAGYTSSDVVAKLRGILHMKKIGHTGTLDPAAEGVLPVCLGSATKLCDMIADHEKEYEAVLRLGVRTDTQDMTGTVLERRSESEVYRTLLHAAREQGGMRDEDQILRYIRHIADGFVGEILQTPPKYSAIWINGKRAYDLARRGVAFDMPARKVVIHELEIEDVSLPLVTFRVRCSKGTYIRTLCEDLGAALGTDGAMEHLLRTRVGMFTLDRALTLEELDILAHWRPEEIRDYVYPVDSFFGDTPRAYVRQDSLFYLANGNPLSCDNLAAVIPAAGDHGGPAAGSSESSCPQKTEDLAHAWWKITEQEKRRPGALVRLYSPEGEFYGVYRYDQTRRRLVCSKMFHEVAGAQFNRR